MPSQEGVYGSHTLDCNTRAQCNKMHCLSRGICMHICHGPKGWPQHEGIMLLNVGHCTPDFVAFALACYIAPCFRIVCLSPAMCKSQMCLASSSQPYSPLQARKPDMMHVCCPCSFMHQFCAPYDCATGCLGKRSRQLCRLDLMASCSRAGDEHVWH